MIRAHPRLLGAHPRRSRRHVQYHPVAPAVRVCQCRVGGIARGAPITTDAHPAPSIPASVPAAGAAAAVLPPPSSPAPAAGPGTPP